MVARLNLKQQNYQDEQRQWVFGNSFTVAHQPWKTQSWRVIGIFQSVSMPNLHSSLPKAPQHDSSVVFCFFKS
jgi:hypothetical protein